MHAHRFRFALIILFIAGIASPVAAAPKPLSTVKPAIQCADLLKVDLAAIAGPGSKVTAASETTKDGIAACVVEATLAPSIKFKATLPTQSWTQRFLQIGCGGLCGNIPQQVGAAEGCAPLNTGGFVTAGTDMGHQGGGGSFGRDVQKRADFAYRGVHLTAVATKVLIKAFYGRDAAYSYFTGCSDGGREALMEAQRYPKDFNGIIAGAAAMNFQVQNSLYHGWQFRANTGPDGKAILIASRLAILHKAVLAQCDKLDGLEDGLIAEPRACHFDPVVVQCKDNPDQQGKDCYSKAEVEAARRLYEGPKDPISGLHLTAGGPLPGSELNWAGVYVPFSADGKVMSENIALDAIRNLIFAQNPPETFKLADLQFDEATFDKLEAHHPLLDATNPDLRAFKAAGGKLILWHGWADPHISPLNTIAYYNAVENLLGKSQAEQFERLYLLPGVSHCSGGEGPSALDLLTPMLAWVESGTAPQEVIAKTAKPNHFGIPGADRPAGPPPNGMPPAGGPAAGGPPAGGPPPGMMAMMPPPQPAVQRTRPVYPYPYIAAYTGKGDPNDAKNFTRGEPLFNGTTPAWAGESFYHPYQPAAE